MARRGYLPKPTRWVRLGRRRQLLIESGCRSRGQGASDTSGAIKPSPTQMPGESGVPGS
jgi:hypothetical protein